MPTYEYQCESCGYEFERFQSIKSRPVRTCPECGEKSVRRLLGTGAALIFKGSGFYATDYRSDSYHRDAKKEKGGGKDGSKGEAKGKEAGGDACAQKPDAACSGCQKASGTCPKES
jgi:putative FmdB family regulatory protein